MTTWLVEHVELVVAIYAAVIATGHLIWRIVDLCRDQAKIILQYRTDQEVLNSLIYESGKAYLVLTVINRGRRPVKIASAGFQYWHSGGGMLSDSLRVGQAPVLDERNPSVDYLADQSQVSINDIAWFFAKDSADRTYKRHTHGLSWIWRRWKKLRHYVNSVRDAQVEK